MAVTADLLPTIPRVFFVYLEPVAILYGAYANYQAFSPVLSISPALSLPTLLVGLTATEFLVTAMLYGLSILLTGPPNKRLLLRHIYILILADFTHWAGLAYMIAKTDIRGRGFAAVLDTKGWTPDMWTLATYPIATLAIKFGTLAGVFGRIRG